MENSEESATKTRGRPFPKGVSGNPAGRPPNGWTWRELLLEAAEEIEKDPVTGEEVTVKKLVARKLVSKAKEGDVPAIREFGDRIDGKPKQGVELSGTGEDGSISVSIKMV